MPKSDYTAHFLFKENTKPCVNADQDEEIRDTCKLKKSPSEKEELTSKQLDEIHQKKVKLRELKRSYLSTISTKFNPDLLAPNGFIRGNTYFSKNPVPKEDQQEQSMTEEKSVLEEEDEDFEKLMKKQGSRYWGGDNPTIKCHNCRQFGHMAKECPNETYKGICILCGK